MKPLFPTLLLLLCIFSGSWERPTTNNAAKDDGKRHFQREENAIPSANNGEEEISTAYGISEAEQRQQQREIARDTFHKLEPKPRGGEMEAADQMRSNHWNSNREGRHGQTKKDVALRHRPLRNGETLLALSSADILNGTSVRAANNCRGNLFKHKVNVDGCRPKTLYRRFCHGSCTSFFIPRLRSKKLKATFQSCAACVPVESDLIQVRLDCPNREEGELYRTVVRVKRCACRNIVLEGNETGEEEGEVRNTDEEENFEGRLMTDEEEDEAEKNQ